MSYLDDIEAWAEAQHHRTDTDRAHIRKLVVVARAVRCWREATCLADAPHSGADCAGDNHDGDCGVAIATADLRTADDALEVP